MALKIEGLEEVMKFVLKQQNLDLEENNIEKNYGTNIRQWK